MPYTKRISDCQHLLAHPGQQVALKQGQRVGLVQAPGAEAKPAPAEKPDDKPATAIASSASGPVVQVGAFDSSAIAENQWARLSGKNSSLFSGKSPVIQQHDSNGRSFWRLRVAGFGSLSEARQFCSALKSSGTDCLALGG